MNALPPLTRSDRAATWVIALTLLPAHGVPSRRRPSTYALQHIGVSMCCVWLCALSSSAVTFPLLSPKSRVELQHIIAPRAKQTPVRSDS